MKTDYRQMLLERAKAHQRALIEALEHKPGGWLDYRNRRNRERWEAALLKRRAT